MKPYRIWTEAENNFMRDNINSICLWSEMAEKLKKELGIERTPNSLSCHARKLGIQIGKSNKYSGYSDAEKEYVANNLDKSLQELCDGLKLLSGRECTRGAVSHFIHDVLKPEGRRSGNFTKGQIPYNTKQNGLETKMSTGYTYVKINNSWIPKQKFIYEQAHGPIKENEFIVFLDKDTNNFEIDNLYPVNRKIHATMCSNHWYTDNSENTLTAIKYCELLLALKQNKLEKETH